ncbi:peptidoglycan-binding protein [Streptomyces misionensis]|uniref:peptidoglycan-binding protein n=1 Tax=Streptomyces misionensis TaxID=67331 RepID=UPI0033BC141C
MGTAQGMIAAARKLLGTTEHPPGSNHNAVTTWYGFSGPWCDMSISYEAAHSGNLAAVMGKFALTTAHARAFQAHGRWHYGLGGIRPGDVVFFDFSGGRSIGGIDHVGLVEAVHSNGTITTLEGNTSDAFRRRVRGRACVVGYGRPAYDGAAPMPPHDGILRKGSTGNAVKTLQKNLNTVQKAGLTVDGRFGTATDRALRTFQAKHNLTVDGEYGPHTAAVMKAALAGKPGVVKPRALVAAATGPLQVDGEFGPATCAALQRVLDAKAGADLDVDGAFGPLTVKALQTYLKVTADGITGPATVIALNKHLGVGSEATWEANTTTQLQKVLNAGTF